MAELCVEDFIQKINLVILDMGMNDIWGTTSNTAFKASMQSCINKIKTANPHTRMIHEVTRPVAELKINWTSTPSS